MDSENTFILAVIRYIITGIVAFVAVCAGSCQMTNYQIRKAIDAGAPPLAATCALSSSNVCDVLEAAEAEATRSK